MEKDNSEKIRLDKLSQSISRYMSLTAIVLMGVGMGITFYSQRSLFLPGGPSLSLDALYHFGGQPAGLASMSLGILILAIIPISRVVIALGLYLHDHTWVSALIATLVILELVLSIRIGLG